MVCNAPTKTIGSPCDIYLAHDIHGTVEWWALLHLKESGARYCCQMLKLWKMSSQQCQSGPNRQIGWVAQISLLIFMVSGGLQKCFVKDLSDKCLILKCAFWMLIYYLVTLKPWLVRLDFKRWGLFLVVYNRPKMSYGWRGMSFPFSFLCSEFYTKT